MKIFQTKLYKVLMNYVYGWGAAVVITGALFKIMHWPLASTILVTGMVVEAIIFFLSSFEPAMEHYDWARVFPVLGKSHNELDPNESGIQTAVMTGIPGAATASVGRNIDLGLEAEDLNKLKSGIHKIAETADNFAGLVENAPDVSGKMAKVSESFDELGNRTQEITKALQNSVSGISSGCDVIGKILADSAESLSVQIKENCEKLSLSLGSSADNFVSLSKLMEEQCDQLKNHAVDYTQQISSINKNISALNALYELQIQGTKECLETFRGVQGDMGEMLENVSLSLDSAKLFKQESQQLAKNVSSLNSVYGNMLSMVNNN